MSFIININDDSHRQFMVRLERILTSNALDKPVIVWHKGEEYCLDTCDQDSYAYAKELQITMDKEGKKIPHV